MTLFKKALAASMGLVTGGLVTFMVINAASENKRRADVFSGHDNHNYYALDVVNGVICAGIGYAMASLCERRQYDVLPNFEGLPSLHEPIPPSVQTKAPLLV